MTFEEFIASDNLPQGLSPALQTLWQAEVKGTSPCFPNSSRKGAKTPSLIPYHVMNVFTAFKHLHPGVLARAI